MLTRLVQGKSSNVQLPAVRMWGCSPVLQVTTVAFDQKKCTFVFPHPGHLEERSRCLDFFLKLYGDPSPLRQVAVDCCVEILNDRFQVQFRADPVLYKDNLPAAMKKFNDMGSL